jgi:3-hydroxyisobutyrate dehydrogenase-like beta-hydroxyacid dehydrogenase
MDAGAADGFALVEVEPAVERAMSDRQEQSSHDASTSPLTVGVLYPGELGAAVGSLLRGRGIRVLTTLGARGHATVRRCREANLSVLDTLEEVVKQSNIVLSLVPPAAAEEVAASYCDRAHLAPTDAIYVDLNSISPQQSAAIGAKIEAAGRSFVDAAVNGLAKNLTKSATLFLSGARAGEVAGLFEGAMRARVLGADAGRASAMKMLLAGLSKGICALFAELSLLARQRNMLGEFTIASAEIYPGIWALAQRMLPTYAQHAARRATEMQELEGTTRAAGLDPCVIAAVRQLHEALAGATFTAGAESDIFAFIEQLAAEQVLTGEMPSAV